MKERYVVGKDFNTKDWFVYDNETEKNICLCDSEEEAMEFVRKIQNVEKDVLTIVIQINELLNQLPETTYVNLFGSNGTDYRAVLSHLEIDDNDETQVIAIVQSIE